MSNVYPILGGDQDGTVEGLSSPFGSVSAEPSRPDPLLILASIAERELEEARTCLEELVGRLK